MKSRWLGPVLAAALALTLRLGYLTEIDDTPLFRVPVVDAATYLGDARFLTEVSWAGRAEPFWQPPLYPYLLAALRASTGNDIWVPRLLQAVAGACLCALMWILGRRLFSTPVCLVAALAAAAYGPLIYFGGELLPTTLGTLLDLALLWALLRTPPTPTWRWLLPGLLLGLSALAVANVLLFLPFILWWLWRWAVPPGQVPSVRPAAARCGFLLLGALVVLAPVTLRNAVVGDDLVLLSHNAGINFYIGNNADYDRTVGIRPGREWDRLTARPRTEAGVKRRSAASVWFFARAWDFARSDPTAYLGLMARKLYLFWHGEEIPRNLDLYYARTESGVLSLLLWKRGLCFPFGLVAPLALWGLAAFLRAPESPTPAGRLLVGFVIVYCASVVLFFVTSRYRLPAVPVLLLFAAYGGAALWRGRQVIASAAVLLVAVAANVGAGAMDDEGSGHEHYWRGWAFEKQGMPANAAGHYRTALARDPDQEDALLNLAALRVGQGAHQEAIDLYRRYLRRWPEVARVREDLAAAYLGSGQFADAALVLDRLLESVAPTAALTGRLGYAHLMAGDARRAADAYRRTLALAPDSALVRYQLARLHSKEGAPDSAAAHYRALLADSTSDLDTRLRLAEALIAVESTGHTGVSLEHTPRTREAEGLLLEELRREPSSTHVRWTLGMLLARQARYDEAVGHFEEILARAPGDHTVHLFLGHLYQRTGRTELAEEHFGRYSLAGLRRDLQSAAQTQTQHLLEQVFETQ